MVKLQHQDIKPECRCNLASARQLAGKAKAASFTLTADS
jgi:hypothetical protein